MNSIILRKTNIYLLLFIVLIFNISIIYGTEENEITFSEAQDDFFQTVDLDKVVNNANTSLEHINLPGDYKQLLSESIFDYNRISTLLTHTRFIYDVKLSNVLSTTFGKLMNVNVDNEGLPINQWELKIKNMLEMAKTSCLKPTLKILSDRLYEGLELIPKSFLNPSTYRELTLNESIYSETCLLDYISLNPPDTSKKKWNFVTYKHLLLQLSISIVLCEYSINDPKMLVEEMQNVEKLLFRSWDVLEHYSNIQFYTQIDGTSGIMSFAQTPLHPVVQKEEGKVNVSWISQTPNTSAEPSHDDSFYNRRPRTYSMLSDYKRKLSLTHQASEDETSNTEIEIEADEEEPIAETPKKEIPPPRVYEGKNVFAGKKNYLNRSFRPKITYILPFKSSPSPPPPADINPEGLTENSTPAGITSRTLLSGLSAGSLDGGEGVGDPEERRDTPKSSQPLKTGEAGGGNLGSRSAARSKWANLKKAVVKDSAEKKESKQASGIKGQISISEVANMLKFRSQPLQWTESTRVQANMHKKLINKSQVEQLRPLSIDYYNKISPPSLGHPVLGRATASSSSTLLPKFMGIGIKTPKTSDTPEVDTLSDFWGLENHSKVINSIRNLDSTITQMAIFDRPSRLADSCWNVGTGRPSGYISPETMYRLGANRWGDNTEEINQLYPFDLTKAYRFLLSSAEPPKQSHDEDIEFSFFLQAPEFITILPSGDRGTAADVENALKNSINTFSEGLITPIGVCGYTYLKDNSNRIFVGEFGDKLSRSILDHVYKIHVPNTIILQAKFTDPKFNKPKAIVEFLQNTNFGDFILKFVYRGVVHKEPVPVDKCAECLIGHYRIWVFGLVTGIVPLIELIICVIVLSRRDIKLKIFCKDKNKQIENQELMDKQ